MTDPVCLVEVTRGPLVESRHFGHAVVADRRGAVVAAWGDANAVVYPRSAIKALQALAIVESGAADRFAVSPEELAVAMASHHSERRHHRVVAAWLDRLGLPVSALGCGARRPLSLSVWADHLEAGTVYDATFDQCSGKHTGMLATALALGAPTAGYLDPAHPVQQRILGILERMTQQDLGTAPLGIDGCGAPTWAMPLGGLAIGMANLADPADQPDARAAACTRLKAAWAAHPDMIGGTDSIDSRLADATGGRVLTKGGAEGVSLACLPDQGLGVALKLTDGDAGKRAAPVAMAQILRGLGVLDDATHERLGTWTAPVLATDHGVETGRLRPSFATADSPL